MKRYLLISIGIIVLVGIAFLACDELEHSNPYDPAASYPASLTITHDGDLTAQMDAGVPNQYIQFYVEGGKLPYAWEIINVTGSCISYATIDTVGKFNAGSFTNTSAGTCRVKVTDIDNATATSGLITVIP